MMSEDMRSRIIELWRDGLSCAAIAREVSLSRNAISGFAFRNRDLCPSRDRIAETFRSIPSRKVRIDKIVSGLKVKGSTRRGPTKRPPASKTVDDAHIQPSPGRFACLGEALEAYHGGCKWPLQDDGGHWFCGALRIETKAGVSSWCAEHHALATDKGTPSEQRALKDLRSAA